MENSRLGWQIPSMFSAHVNAWTCRARFFVPVFKTNVPYGSRVQVWSASKNMTVYKQGRSIAKFNNPEL